MQQRSGWFLPDSDTYFAQFVAGPPPKRNGFYRDHLEVALGYVKRFDTAIDVGAHCGFWAWDMAHRFKVIYAFEPVPSTFQCLIKNVAEYDNVVCHNLAVGAQAGHVRICNDRQRPGNTGSNYVMPDASGSVEMVTLDEFEFCACDFLKIDVEGFELRVLEGAKKLIKEYRPVISMEVSDYKFRGRYPSIQEGAAEQWLQRRGYRRVWAQKPDAVFICT